MSVFQRLGKVISSHIKGLADKQTTQDQIFTENYKYQKVNTHSKHNHHLDEKESEYRANLEIDATTNMKGIRSSYKNLMKKYHPDLHASDQNKRETAEQITQKLNEAMNYFEKKHNQ